MLTRIIKPIKSFFKEVFFAGYIEHSDSGTNNYTNDDEFSSPRYPPLDLGIEFIPVKSVLLSQKTLIDRIQKTAGLQPDEFAEHFSPVIENLARYIHLLPATRTSHHRGAGGLLRLTLEMGLYSLQIANATIFASSGTVSAEIRYKLHPRWVYATFVAGICAELYRPITNMVVANEDGDEWPQLLIPLYDWSENKKDKRYFVVWNEQDESNVIAMHQTTAAYILNVIVPMIGLQYLNKNNTEIMSAMTTSVTNTVANGSLNQIHEIVKSVRRKVIDRDIRGNSERYGDFTVGSHLEPHLLDAMRKLVRRKTWEVNVKGSRIWYSNEGMFIVWQPAAKEMISVFKEANMLGIPTEADTLADILISSGIAECNQKEGRYWEICIPVSLQFLPALKLQKVEVLFQNETDITALTEPLLPENLRSLNLLVKKTVDEGNPKFPNPLQIDQVSTASDSDLIKSVIGKLDVGQEVLDNRPPRASGGDPHQTGSKNTKKNTELEISIPELPIFNSDIGTGQTQSIVTIEDISSERIFKSLSNDVSDYLRAIVEDHLDGSSNGPVFSTHDGVAISVKELESHGQANFTGLVKTLYEKTWLWTDPQKPMKKIIDLNYEGVDLTAIVIRKDIARSMGFKWTKTGKGT